MRRYNADLANDFGNLLNRSLSMTKRYRDGAAFGTRPQGAAGRERWATTFATYGEKLEACLLHEALETLWEFVGEANKFVEAEQPWTLAKAAKSGDAEADDAAHAACWATCSRPAASSPSRPHRSCPEQPLEPQPSWASTTATPTTATAARRCASLLPGVHLRRAVASVPTEPLFPRLETDEPEGESKA